jgi:hypothetical protein
MSQQVGITIGIPILSAIVAMRRTQLAGTRLALSVDVAVTLASMVLIWFGLRQRDETPAAGTAQKSEADDEVEPAALPM